VHRRSVERQQPALRIGGGEPAQQVVEHVLVEGLQVGDLLGGLLEPDVGALGALRERPAQQRDGEEPEQVDRHGVLRDAGGRQPGCRVIGERQFQESGRVHELCEDQAHEEHRAQRRHLQAAAPPLHGAGGHDGQHVQRREQAVDAAGDVHAGGDEDRVEAEMHVGQPRNPVGVAQRRDEREADEIGEADDGEERVDGLRARRLHLHDDGEPEQHGCDHQSQRDVPGQPLPQRARSHQPASLLMRPKMGMYMAMTMPPTTPPRNAIMTGSSSVSMPATAASTSSS
jgi:hypothetical protein